MKPVTSIFLPVALAYGAALWWIWEMWFLDGSYYAHGPLVPLVGALVIWARRQQWRPHSVVVDPRGWWLLGLLPISSRKAAALLSPGRFGIRGDTSGTSGKTGRERCRAGAGRQRDRARITT